MAVGPSPILTVKPQPIIVEVGDEDVLIEEPAPRGVVHA